MDKYNNTLTQGNLEEAFRGEAEGVTKYLLYSREALSQGREDISSAFAEVAGDELGHAGVWLGELGEMVDTKQNLESAAKAESRAQALYRKAASDAEDEGFDELSGKFLMAADVEKEHEEAFNRLLRDFDVTPEENDSGDMAVFKCQNCGYQRRFRRRDMRSEFCPLCGFPLIYLRRLLRF